MIKGVIFDLDGTLLDSMSVWDSAGQRYLEYKNIPAPDDIRGILNMISADDAARYFISRFSLDSDVETVIREIDSVVESDYQHRVPLKPYVHIFLEKLKEMNIPMCIATASGRRPVESALKRLDIAHFFSFLITCEEVGVGKQNPKIYLEALEKLGTKKEDTLVFEDALYAVKTAKSAGFTVIGVEDKISESDAAQIKGLADMYITTFENLADKLFSTERDVCGQ